MSDSSSEEDEIIHTSSVRCRNLLEQGYTPARLSDYAHGKVQKLIETLNALYASFATFHPFEESEGDADRLYYTDSKTGEAKGVTTIYFKYTEIAKATSNRWNILDINFKKTAEASAKIAYDFQHGKSKTYFGTLMINPFLPRNAKLRETENVIRQLREGIKWGIGADKYVISGEFKMNGGWQWFIAAEYFKKYVQKIELLFFEKKITDLEGNILRIYNESESSQMVADIAAREKADSKRKMVAYINTSTEFTAEQLEELRTKALAATIAAEENVFTYDGHKEFKKPKKNNKPPSVNITCKKQDGKKSEYWRITTWVLLSSKEMAAAPSTVMCWQLIEHPTVALNRFGNHGKSNPKSFAKSQKAAWETYSSSNNKRKKDFGKAGESRSSSSASASSGSQPALPQKYPLQHLATVADKGMKESDDVMERLLLLESSMKAAATQEDLTRTEQSIAIVASKEVTKRFKAFQDIMLAFALEMTTIKQNLGEAVEFASQLASKLTAEVSLEQRMKIKESFSGMDFSAEEIEKIVNQSIENSAAREAATAKQVTKIATQIEDNASRLIAVTAQVEGTVEKLAREAGVDYSSPKTLKIKNCRPGTAEKISQEISDLGLGSNSDSDSESPIQQLKFARKKSKTAATVTPKKKKNKKSKKKNNTQNSDAQDSE